MPSRRRRVFGRPPLVLSVFAAGVSLSIIACLGIFYLFRRYLHTTFEMKPISLESMLVRVHVREGGSYGTLASALDGNVLLPIHVVLGAAAVSVFLTTSLQIFIWGSSTVAPMTAPEAKAAAAGPDDDDIRNSEGRLQRKAKILRVFNVFTVLSAVIAMGGFFLIFSETLARVGMLLMDLAVAGSTVVSANVLLTDPFIKQAATAKKDT